LSESLSCGLIKRDYREELKLPGEGEKKFRRAHLGSRRYIGQGLERGTGNLPTNYGGKEGVEKKKAPGVG